MSPAPGELCTTRDRSAQVASLVPRTRGHRAVTVGAFGPGGPQPRRWWPSGAVGWGPATSWWSPPLRWAAAPEQGLHWEEGGVLVMEREEEVKVFVSLFNSIVIKPRGLVWRNNFF